MAGGSMAGAKKRGHAVAKTRPKDRSKDFERALEAGNGASYTLKLYVTGSTPRSVRAIENIQRICEEHLKGRYRLEIVDIYQQPELAEREQLVVAPTLVKQLPLPLRTFIGDLSQTERILIGLDVLPKKGDLTRPKAGQET
jgi:circadian clock protein KaiB